MVQTCIEVLGFRRNMQGTYKKAITVETLNPNIVRLQLTICRPILQRVVEIEKELKKGLPKPFNKVIKMNVGDCHAMGQVPISFIRQVLACVLYPEFIKLGNFPKDVRERAQDILNACNGSSIGSYSTGVGIEKIRRSVAKYIEERDGFKADWKDICLTTGASAGIKFCLQLLINNIDGKPSGVMVPIPLFPLYSYTLAEYGLYQVDYYLDESKKWALTVKELERAFKEASRSCKIRSLVVINPGNPTGQVLSREDIENTIKFAYNHSLLLLADEVYQHNIYEGEFHSFKKVLMEMKAPYNDVELVSFMSASKGYMGECGLRGGWMEILNMEPKMQANLFMCITATSKPTTLGQVVVDCIARPPKEGDESYELYVKEKDSVLQSLRAGAKIVEELFNRLEGFRCNVVQGAIYAFPRMILPPRAIEASKRASQEPDMFYAFRLLEETGIYVTSGSEFGQEPGTYHFRISVLPQTELLAKMVDILEKFHLKFMKEFS